MNWNNERNLILVQQHLLDSRVDTLPEWAQCEKIYNCETFYQTMRQASTRSGVREVRRVLARILRVLADLLYSQEETKAYV